MQSEGNPETHGAMLKKNSKKEKVKNKKELQEDYDNVKNECERLKRELEYERENTIMVHDKIKEITKEKNEMQIIMNKIASDDDNELKKQLASSIVELRELKKENLTINKANKEAK